MITSKKIVSGVLSIVTAAALFSFELPAGWFKAGSKPNSYDMGTDKGAGKDGNNVATIKSVDKKIDGFGTLMQTSSAQKYLGQRVRMSASVKSKDVHQKAGLWLRVDGAGSKNYIAFDNMADRPITGTSDWKQYEIVLDVPLNASKLAYGALLRGTGQIWFDDIKFDIVDSTIGTTGLKENKEPVNLNFEE
ncbi:MAG TPA: hypothetical protein PKN75_13305 [Bacteroidia bacterium]|nr:hypothetical protein [Bacteroidia bacterium]HNU34559.1 hypothetical protein [Bacteroidia bacterium]